MFEVGKKYRWKIAPESDLLCMYKGETASFFKSDRGDECTILHSQFHHIEEVKDPVEHFLIWDKESDWSWARYHSREDAEAEIVRAKFPPNKWTILHMREVV